MTFCASYFVSVFLLCSSIFLPANFTFQQLENLPPTIADFEPLGFTVELTLNYKGSNAKDFISKVTQVNKPDEYSSAGYKELVKLDNLGCKGIVQTKFDDYDNFKHFEFFHIIFDTPEQAKSGMTIIKSFKGKMFNKVFKPIAIQFKKKLGEQNSLYKFSTKWGDTHLCLVQYKNLVIASLIDAEDLVEQSAALGMLHCQ